MNNMHHVVYFVHTFKIRKLNTVKPRKTEFKFVTKTGFYRQATAQCSMLALQNGKIGAFCNARMLHLALKCCKNTKNHIFEKINF